MSDKETKTLSELHNEVVVLSETKMSPEVNQSGGISRRNFLKILGTASTAAVVGCADKATQNILPNLKGFQPVPNLGKVWVDRF